MNDAYWTSTEERPALAQNVNPPEGYIGTRLMPVSPILEKAASVAYATLVADAAAQTGRVAGVAPNKHRIANSATTVACTELTDRAAITPDEAKQMGGIENADERGATRAKRTVLGSLEVLIRTAVFPAAVTDYLDFDNILTQFQTARQTIRRYPGRTALAAGTETLAALITGIAGSDTFGSMFARIVSGASSAAAIQGLSLQAHYGALSTLLGVDEILPGDDDVWGAGHAENALALVKIDADPDPMAHKWLPVFGRTFQFLPDGVSPWLIRSIADYVNVDNLYDAYLWQNVKILNSAAVARLAIQVSS